MCASTKAGVSPVSVSDVLFATSASRDGVDLLAVVNVGQDYRDLMNAGKALLRLAKFESASQSAERVTPPMRGIHYWPVSSDVDARVGASTCTQPARCRCATALTEMPVARRWQGRLHLGSANVAVVLLLSQKGTLRRESRYSS